MDFAALRNNVEQLAAAAKTSQSDDEADRLVEMAVFTVGECLVSIAESLYDIGESLKPAVTWL